MADDGMVAVLQAKFPDSPAAECQRFLSSYGNDLQKASEALDAHTKWRSANLPLAAGAPRYGAPLPEWHFFFKHLKAKDGTPIIFSQPARLNVSLASAEQISMASAQFMEDLAGRDEAMKVTVVVDLAPILESAGGVNSSAVSIVSYLRQLNNTIMYNYPGRVQRLVAYPVPYSIKLIWDTAIKQVLSQQLVDMTILLNDDLGEGRVPPSLSEYVDLDVLRGDARCKELVFDSPKIPEEPGTLSSAYEALPSSADLKAGAWKVLGY